MGCNAQSPGYEIEVQRPQFADLKVTIFAVRPTHQPDLVDVRHGYEHGRMAGEGDLGTTVGSRQGAVAKSPEHGGEMPLLGGVLIEFGLFNAQDQTGRLGWGSWLRRWLSLNGCRWIWRRLRCARKVLQQGEDESSLEPMALPIDRTAQIRRRSTRPRRLAWGLADLCPPATSSLLEHRHKDP